MQAVEHEAEALETTEPHRAGTEQVLARLRGVLEDHHYHTVHRLHCYELAPRALDASLRKSIERAPAPTQRALRFFYFQEPLARAQIESLLGRELTAEVESAGLIVPAAAAGAVAARYRMDLAGDTWLLTDPRGAGRDGVYFGEDSQFLRAMLAARSGDVCLDLCTGSGVQALRCAPQAAHVDAVDLDAKAVHLARLNAALNGVADKLQVHEGDLWDALPRTTLYDLVCCNPPLVPVPEDVRYPLCGHGGADGLDLVRRVLEPLPTRLGPGGRALVIGACTGTDERPDVLDAATDAVGASMQVDVFLLLRVPLRDWVAMLAQTVQALYPGASPGNTVVRSRARYGAAFDASFVYTYLLVCSRPARTPATRIFDYSKMGHRSYWFIGRGRVA